MLKIAKRFPVLWLVLAVISMFALHWLGPKVHYLNPPWNWLGLLPLMLGLFMAAVSARAFRKAETGLIPFDEATALVTNGFFRYSRNPMYLGMLLFLLGLAVIFACLPVIVPVICFVLIIQFLFIRREERFMEDAFGAEYRDYRQRVRRWL